MKSWSDRMEQKGRRALSLGLFVCLACCRVSTATVPLGRPEENQRVLLGLGGHVPVHQQQPALAARGTQRLWFLCLPGGAPGLGPESQSMHRHSPRPHLWKSSWWDAPDYVNIKQGLTTWLVKKYSSSFCVPWTGNPNQSTRPSCKKPCSLHTNCGNCTSQAMECMWCGSAKRCVDSTAYVISFPYGQCLEWQTGDCLGECLFTELNLDPASFEVYSLALKWPALSFPTLASVRSQYSSLREGRLWEEKRLKVEAVCVRGKTVLVSPDWLWRLFLLCNGQLLSHIVAPTVRFPCWPGCRWTLFH